MPPPTDKGKFVAQRELKLADADRVELWPALTEAVEDYLRDVDGLDAAPKLSGDAVRAAVDAFDFDRPMAPIDALRHTVDALRRLQPHVRHPRHFGLFDAAPTTMGVVGETLAALFNPCLASTAGSPFGVAAEARLVAEFGRHFGYAEDSCDGVMTSGGSESNFSALLLALTHHFPEHRERGLRALRADPVVYVTAEAHPSLPKAAVLAGLGCAAVRTVSTDRFLRIDLTALEEEIRADRAAGRAPLMIAVTAGTTGAGAVDPMEGAADIAVRHGAWLHIDAAWGGAAALLPELRPVFAGIERADSITFDAHKWMAVPKSAGMLLTRHRSLLNQTFHIGPSFLSDDDADSVDPLERSFRWSRGFEGLKVLLSLAVAGWYGYQRTWRQQIWLGDFLREQLGHHDWRVVNDTRLPVVCFVDEQAADGDTEKFLDRVADAVNNTGQAKVFRVTIGGRPALRACITNYDTSKEDIGILVDLLASARTQVRAA